MYDCLIKHKMLDTDLIRGPVIDLKLIGFYDAKRSGDIPFYCFSMVHGNHTVGKITLRLGYDEESFLHGQVGYEIIKAYQGHHYAYYGLMMIMALAKSHGYQRMLVTMEKDNAQSLKTVLKAGGTYLKEVTVPKDHIYYVLGIKEVSLYEIRL